MGKEVPKVLLSGNPKNINLWRKEASIARTKERRPDLYAKYEILEKCRAVLQKQKLLHVDMTELINRGQAELVYAKGATICLYDKVSGIYFHTTDKAEHGCLGLEKIKTHAKNRAKNRAGMEQVGCLVLHQEFMQTAAHELLQMKTTMICRQAVYTRKEKLPITGLYAINAKPATKACGNQDAESFSTERELPEIRKIGLEFFKEAAAHYEGFGDAAYLEKCLKKGNLYGAFLQEKFVGYIGRHEEGGIGMLQVFPKYRRRKIGKALETYLINLSLELGHTPFGQVEEGNENSMALQESLGMCFAKGNIYWLEKE